jgi:hypothetical protein
MIVICFRKVKNSSLLEPWSFRNSSTDKKIHDMSSAINEIDMEFKEIKNVNIETIGSLSQSTRPCPIKYKSMKAQHQQVKLDRRQTLTEFIVF